MSIFTSVDVSKVPDQLTLAFYAFFIFAATLANKLHVPFLTRDGGLLTYSKFANGVNFGPTVGSRPGMVVLYTPAMLIGLVGLMQSGAPLAAIFHNRAALVSAMMFVHFAKRALECAFLHKYSGKMPVTTVVTIAAFYSIIALCAVHYSGLAAPISSPDLPGGLLSSVGLLLFAIGLLGNFFHHYLLATLRKPGETTYKVPHGGFFDIAGGVACPHYLFELIGWGGVALTSQHVVMVTNFAAMFFYLCDRAMAQSEWNRTVLKEKYPKTRKHIFPMVF